MASTAVTTRLTPSESILWRIERDPVLRSTVTAVTLLDRAPDWPRLQRRMLRASMRIPRLRQVVVEPPLGIGSPSWAPVADFDLDYHLRRMQLPGDTDAASLLEFAAHEAMREFDRARPLWEFTVVDDVDGGAALIQKFHHAVTDGVGGMRLALEMLDTTRSGRTATRVGPLDTPDTTRTPSTRSSAAALAAPHARDTGDSMARQMGEVARHAAGLSQRLVLAAAAAGRDPLRSVAGTGDSLRWASRLLAPASQPCSPLMRGRGIMLAFAAFDVDFERLRAAGRRGGGSLNDAFIASVMAGLRRYHEAHGVAIRRLRMTLPVSIRSETDPAGGNRFVPVRFEVPVEPSEPAVVIPSVAGIVREWRHGPALGMTDALAAALNGLPTAAVTAAFASMLRNVDFVATNVPGIPVRAYLAGAELLRQYAFAPPSGAALNVAFVSHVGCGCVGVNIDRTAVPDVGVLVGCLEAGFDEVMAHAEPHATARPGRAPGSAARATAAAGRR